MKIKGEKIEGPNIETIVIPRGNRNDIVFHCQAVLDMKPFDQLCPIGDPPTKLLPNNRLISDVENPSYKARVAAQGEKRIQYIILKSLEATEELEWETVDMGDADTWGNYEQELKDSGFSAIEIMRIQNKCMEANCLSEAKLDEARESFLATQSAQANGSYSQKGGLLNMPSGEPASE